MEIEEAIKRYENFIQAFKHDDTKSFIVFDVKAIETVLQELKNSIPKKKIEDKIEELVKIGNYRTENNPDGHVHFREEPCDYQIQVLQELLEEK